MIFTEEIHELIPKITKRKAYYLLCSMRGRYKKYWVFGIGKRDGKRFWISERQMSYFVKLLVDYWFLEKKREVIGSRNYPCAIYKASKALQEMFLQIRDGINVSNLTQRIKDFNESHNTFEYLRGYWVAKRNKIVIWERFIVSNRGKYSQYVYDSEREKKLTLFEYLRGDKNVIETCREYKIIG